MTFWPGILRKSHLVSPDSLPTITSVPLNSERMIFWKKEVFPPQKKRKEFINRSQLIDTDKKVHGLSVQVVWTARTAVA